MTVLRAVVLLATLAIVSASLLALASRAPESVREAEAGPDAADASHGASFTQQQVARHGAYRGPAYLSVGLSLVLQVITLALLARVLVPELASRLRDVPGGWAAQVILVTVFVVVIGTLVALPLSFVRSFLMDHAWGLSTQPASQWFFDAGRSLGVALATGSIAAVAFFGLVRTFPRSWWLWGWAVFSLLSILMTFLWPILIAPLFNKFTPLESGPLRDRVVALAAAADVAVEDVLVADASKRTTAENAYVAGVGSSRQMVLYDTLVDAGDLDETAYVAAHELGHEVHDHIWKFVALSSVTLFMGFAALRWLAGRPEVWSWAGASGVSDPRALPLLALFIVVGGLLILPLQNTISRAFERQADEAAIRLTGDPATAVKVYRRLAFSNLGDLAPPRPAVWVLFTHPPIPERIENVLSASEGAKNS